MRRLYMPLLVTAYLASCSVARELDPQVRDMAASMGQFIAAIERGDSATSRNVADSTAIHDINRIRRYEPGLFNAMARGISIVDSHKARPDSAIVWFETSQGRVDDVVVTTLVRVQGQWRIVGVGALPR